METARAREKLNYFKEKEKNNSRNQYIISLI